MRNYSKFPRQICQKKTVQQKVSHRHPLNANENDYCGLEIAIAHRQGRSTLLPALPVIKQGKDTMSPEDGADKRRC